MQARIEACDLKEKKEKKTNSKADLFESNSVISKKTQSIPIPTFSESTATMATSGENSKSIHSSGDSGSYSARFHKKNLLRSLTSSSSNKSDSHSHSTDAPTISTRHSLKKNNLIVKEDCSSHGIFELSPRFKEDFFSLDLEIIIDCSLHGKTLAYRGENFQKQQAKMEGKINYQELTAFQFFEYKTTILNKLQIEKMNIITKLVALLNVSYCKVTRSAQEHDEFCQELMYMTVLCMSVSHASWKEMLKEAIKTMKHVRWKEDEKPTEHISRFWNGLLFSLTMSPVDNTLYKDLIKKLVDLTEKLFALDKQVQELKDKQMAFLSLNEKEPAYVTIEWIDFLCQKSLKKELVDRFRTQYIKDTECNQHQFVGISDLFFYIDVKKTQVNVETLMELELIEVALKHAYPSQYQRVMKKLSLIASEAQYSSGLFSK